MGATGALDAAAVDLGSPGDPAFRGQGCKDACPYAKKVSAMVITRGKPVSAWTVQPSYGTFYHAIDPSDHPSMIDMPRSLAGSSANALRSLPTPHPSTR